MKEAKMKRSFDQFDLEAEREGNARRRFRELEACPTILGRRISGCKARYKGTKPATNAVILRHTEEKGGFGSR